jgi:hypothetical protein
MANENNYITNQFSHDPEIDLYELEYHDWINYEENSHMMDLIISESGMEYEMDFEREKFEEYKNAVTRKL